MSETAEVKFACPECGKQYPWKASLAQRNAKCKNCGHVFSVPAKPPVEQKEDVYELAPQPEPASHSPSPKNGANCTACGTKIQATTAQRTGGLCGPCSLGKPQTQVNEQRRQHAEMLEAEFPPKSPPRGATVSYEAYTGHDRPVPIDSLKAMRMLIAAGRLKKCEHYIREVAPEPRVDETSSNQQKVRDQRRCHERWRSRRQWCPLGEGWTATEPRIQSMFDPKIYEQTGISWVAFSLLIVLAIPWFIWLITWEVQSVRDVTETAVASVKTEANPHRPGAGDKFITLLVRIAADDPGSVSNGVVMLIKFVLFWVGIFLFAIAGFAVAEAIKKPAGRFVARCWGS